MNKETKKKMIKRKDAAFARARELDEQINQLTIVKWKMVGAAEMLEFFLKEKEKKKEVKKGKKGNEGL